MGNHQAHHQNMMHVIREPQETRRLGFISRKRQKLEELRCRRQSMPSTQLQATTNPRHDNFHSLSFGDDSQTPRIQINGQDSVESEENPLELHCPNCGNYCENYKNCTNCTSSADEHQNGRRYTKFCDHKNCANCTSYPNNQRRCSKCTNCTNNYDNFEDHENSPSTSTPPSRRQSDHLLQKISPSYTCVSIDSAEGMKDQNQNTPVKKHRFIRNPKTAATRRMEFLSFSNNFAARSLDEGAHFEAQKIEYELDIKPLSHRARSLSPLKQLRTYSSRQFPSDESVLTSEHCAFIKVSWKMAMERIQTTNQPSFGFLCMKRILEKMPELKQVFKVSDINTADRLPTDHTFARHVGLVQSILDLAVRNVEQLETEIAPALFTYGKRHYQHNLASTFNEATIRLFCGQVVCTMLDVLSDRLTTDSMEAWIELMRYLGRVLYNGFEYERLAKTKKFAINTKDHAYFLA
ncbi:unnamed protein product [Bursaphelenchus okinawaensis]|uniref:Globin domain-containing protein n=1 Tax=Bursaphelenchus okinawaensis TaxID=465554 RepID=A0A811KY67_9BILA|nr:unnamed protein product [Bursaphelenchus okinawaensis]CAG9113627.1 unnamed protein product [Bursaphelenchus okinawaensis]